jgi:mRNA-degrading endonuclease RelE of RelBE toxin-antitoxin system
MPNAAIHLDNNYRVATQKERAADATEPKGLLRNNEASTKQLRANKFSSLISNVLENELMKLDDSTLEKVVKKMKQIEERPLELGEPKSGMFAGFMTVKFEDQSYVLLYKVNVKENTVKFYRYEHHKYVYQTVPDESQLSFRAIGEVLTG